MARSLLTVDDVTAHITDPDAVIDARAEDVTATLADDVAAIVRDIAADGTVADPAAVEEWFLTMRAWCAHTEPCPECRGAHFLSWHWQGAAPAGR